MFNRRAQGTLEFVILICLIVAAMIAMQVYFRRGLQGRVRAQIDEISGGGAYAPTQTLGDKSVTKGIYEHSLSVSTGNSHDFNFLNNPVTESQTWASQTQATQGSEETLGYIGR